MKVFLLPLLAACFPFALIFRVEAAPVEHPGGYPFPSDEKVKQTVQIEVQNVDNDEFLMAFAKAANFNILVDATDAPTDAPPIDMKEKDSIINFALNFSKYRGYATQRYSNDTLLFWPQSDKKALARQLLETHKARWNQQLADALPPESTKRAMLLRDYFQNNLGWNGKWEGVDLRVKVKDLPPDLRDLILSEMNAQIAYKVTNIDRLLYRMRDEFWQTATLSIEQIPDRQVLNPQNAAKVPTLMLNEKQTQKTPQNSTRPTSLTLGPLTFRRP